MLSGFSIKAFKAESLAQYTISNKESSHYYYLLLIFTGIDSLLLLMILWIRIAEIDQAEEVKSKQSLSSLLPKFGDEK